MEKCTVQWKQLVIQHIQQISKTKTTHSTRELKNIKSKFKEPAEEKKKPSKRQLFHLSRPMLYNMRSTDTFQLLQVVSSTYSSQIYKAGFAKKQFHLQNSLRQTRSFFFSFFSFFYQNTFYRIPNQNVLFKASFFITFSLHSKMIVMQQFNDKNILIFYYTAARSQLSIKSTQTSLNENL